MTVHIELPPSAAVLPATGGAQHIVNAGSNFPVPALAFDGGSSDEECYFHFRAFEYGSGNLTIDIDWYAATASSGDVKWGAQLGAITPNSDSGDIESKSLDTAATVVDSHLGTTGKRLHRATITLSDLDGLAADDDVVLRIYRAASDTGNDTMAGDAQIVGVAVSYSET